MDNEDKEKKEYELALLLKAEEDMTHVAAFLREHNAEISVEPRAKKLALAYKIKDHTDAVFTYLNFRAFPADAKQIEHDLNTDAFVIRSMIIASPPAPSERASVPYFPGARRTSSPRPSSGPSSSAAPSEPKPAPAQHLSNEALEKKIEEILK